MSAIVTAIGDDKIATLQRGNLGSNYVSQHNHLIMATYQLTLTEKKLLLACISKINSLGRISSETPFSFDMLEGAELFGFDLSNAGVIAAFKKASLGLIGKTVVNEHVKGWKATSFAQASEYDHDTKTMSIWFSFRVIPYLSDLHTTFTTFRLLHIGKLSSQHSIRLYELLMMYLGINYGKPCEKKFEIEEFKQLMHCSGMYKDNFSVFKTRLIEAPIEQINDETDLHITAKYSKNGRFFTHVTLSFSTKEIWKEAEKEFKQILSQDQIRKIVNNAVFFNKYFSLYSHLGGVTEFLAEASRLLTEDPKKHFSDYANYLKD